MRPRHRGAGQKCAACSLSRHIETGVSQHWSRRFDRGQANRSGVACSGYGSDPKRHRIQDRSPSGARPCHYNDLRGSDLDAIDSKACWCQRRGMGLTAHLRW